MASNIILDISRYQMQADFQLLKSVGQDYIIMKAGSGNGTTDAKFSQHYAQARTAGMVVCPYFWVDPIYDSIRQAKHFLSLIESKEIGFIVLDFEQWWADWAKWSDMIAGRISGGEVPKFPPENMLAHLKSVYDYMISNTDKNIVIYTASWFLNAYCKQGFGFLQDKFTHWADYSRFSSASMSTSWDYLESIVPIGIRVPSIPWTYPLDKVLMWQFSGDKFSAPGVYANDTKTRLSPLDLNVWINPRYSIENICKFGVGEEPSEPPVVVPPEVTRWRVTATTGLNIRQSASIYSTKIGSLLYNTIINVSTIEDNWAKLYDRDGYVSLSYLQKVSTTPTTGSSWRVTATLGLNIRENPLLSAQKIGQLSYNTPFNVSSITVDNWGQLADREGYVYLLYAKKIS